MSKKNKKIQPQKFSPKSYLKERGRNLPIYKCWINEDWEDEGMAHIYISRKHSNGNLTFGSYLVDLLEKGLKDSFARVNEPEDLIDEIFRDYGMEFIEADYDLVHNIVYGGLEFTEEMGHKRDKEFSWTQYVLEADTEDIPVMDIPFGYEEEVDEDFNFLHQSSMTTLNLVDMVYHLTFGEEPRNPDFYEKRLDAGDDVGFKSFDDEEVKNSVREMENFLPYLEAYEKIVHEETVDPAELDSLQGKIETDLLQGKRIPQLYDLLSNIFIQKEDNLNALRVVQNQLKAFPDHATSKLFVMLKLMDMGKIEEVEALLEGALDIRDLPFSKRGLTEFEVCLFYTVLCQLFIKRKDFDKAEVYYDFIRKFQMKDKTLITSLHLEVLLAYGEYKRKILEEYYGKPLISILEEEEKIVNHIKDMAKTNTKGN